MRKPLPIAAVALLALVGCSQNPPLPMHQPALIRPAAPAAPAPRAGTVFAEGSYVPLFEDRRARFLGDTLTIQINEKINASKKSGSAVTKSSSLSALGPNLTVGSRSIAPIDLSAKSGSKFEGKGDSASSNLFTGTLTVTVIEVLANGNLLVAGEKQMGINQGSEYLRFSGVVNPTTILAGNVVSSTQVAEARIEYRGVGYLEEAQNMGLLARFFLSVFPF